MILHQGQSLFNGGDDEDIPSSSTISSIEDVAIQDKVDEVRLGPMTRSRSKLIEQHVNSLLVEYEIGRAHV